MSRESIEHALFARQRSSRGHLVLVGSNHQENLALQYLAAALEDRGFSVDIVGYNDRSDAPALLKLVRERAPLLVGLQFAFQYTIEDNLWLAEGLRSDGYRGHLTAGGHVATFCYEALLTPNSPLDSVVRHEGERTLVEIVERLSRGENLESIAGCVHRSGAGLCVEPPRGFTRKLDDLPVPRRPERPYRVAGIPIAFLLTSRGCHGDCNYCCINAFSRDAGGPAYRLRSPEAVAFELGTLAERDVRAVFVQDDLFILPSERATIARLSALTEACQALKLPDFAYWIKGRPESITPNVVDAMKRFGALHVFLGIENASEERLAYLGRTHQPRDAERALELCQASGIHPSFNVMLFDPDCTLSDVDRNLDFLERHVDLPWNVCRTEIYPGTHIFERLSAEGRLYGDYRSYGYRMKDEACELLFRILRVSLHERALATQSLHNRLISLAFAWQLHLRLFGDEGTRAIAEEARALGQAVRQDTIARLRRAVAWVKAHVGETLHGGESTRAREFMNPDNVASRYLKDNVSQFAVSEGRAIGLADFPHHQQAERLWDLLHARGRYLNVRNVTSALDMASTNTP